MTNIKHDPKTGKVTATFNILEDLDVYNDLPTPQHTQDVINFLLDASLTPEQKAKAEPIRTAPESAQKLWIMQRQLSQHNIPQAAYLDAWLNSPMNPTPSILESTSSSTPKTGDFILEAVKNSKTDGKRDT